jgi:hypothetical protein
MDELSRGDSYFVASPLNQGEKTKVRDFITGVRCFKLRSPSPKPTLLPSLVRQVPDLSLPNGREKGEVTHTPAVQFGVGDVPQQITESDFLIPTSERL